MRKILILWLTCSFLFIPVSGEASKESESMVKKGHKALKKQQYEKALTYFDRANIFDTSDSEAVFFLGVTLNRLGLFPEAVIQLKQAEIMGYENDSLPFELGWALLEINRPKDAINSLNQYEAQNPGLGQTSELLGRCFMALRQNRKAEEYFAEALSRNPKLRGSVTFYQAILARESNNATLAQEKLNALLKDSPRSPTARALKAHMDRIIEIEGDEDLVLDDESEYEDSRWHMWITVNGGYDDNVITLGDNLTLPGAITQQESFFGLLTLGTSYDWFLDNGDNIEIGYITTADVLEGNNDAESWINYWYGNYRRELTEELTANLRLSNEYVKVDGSSFRNTVSTRPSLIYQHWDWIATELAYQFSWTEHFRGPALMLVTDRDNDQHKVSLTNYFKILDTEIRGRLGYFATETDADGSDFDRTTHGLIAGLGRPLPWMDTYVDVSYTRTFARYKNRTSTSGLFAYNRKENIDKISVEVSKKLNKDTKVFGRYDYTNSDSNIGVFDYQRHRGYFGFTINLF